METHEVRGVITIRIPIATVSLTNMREHWAKKARRAKQQRQQTYLMTQRLTRLKLPATITLTRISSRNLDDDNLRGALKSVRDGVADRLGIDDGESGVKWQYAQERGKVGEKAVEITATPGDAGVVPAVDWLKGAV